MLESPNPPGFVKFAPRRPSIHKYFNCRGEVQRGGASSQERIEIDSYLTSELHGL